MSKDEYLIFKDMLGKLKDAIIKTNCGIDLIILCNCSYNEGLLPVLQMYSKEYFSRICLVDFYNCKSSEDGINKQKVKDGSMSFEDLHSEGKIPTKEWFYENYNSIKLFIGVAKGLTEEEKNHAQMLICDCVECIRPQAITNFIEEIEDFWRNWVSEQYNKYAIS